MLVIDLLRSRLLRSRLLRSRLLCARLLWVRRIGHRTRRGPWPGDNESHPSRNQHHRQPRSGRQPLADEV
jgi:hypothetical protein